MRIRAPGCVYAGRCVYTGRGAYTRVGAYTRTVGVYTQGVCIRTPSRIHRFLRIRTPDCVYAGRRPNGTRYAPDVARRSGALARGSGESEPRGPDAGGGTGRGARAGMTRVVRVKNAPVRTARSGRLRRVAHGRHQVGRASGDGPRRRRRRAVAPPWLAGTGARGAPGGWAPLIVTIYATPAPRFEF